MRKTLSTRLVVLLGAGALFAACGDNNGQGDDGGDDASPIDGMPADADLSPTVGSTLAITDVTVTDPLPAASDPHLKGAAISLEFTDLTTGGGTNLFGTSAVGGCVVTGYDATHSASPSIDAGAITISGDGKLMPVGPCTYQAGAGYLCISAASSMTSPQAIDVSAGAAGLTNYKFNSTDAFAMLSAQDTVGAYLKVGGFTTHPEFNSATAFPIVRQTNGTDFVVLTVINSGATATTTDTTAVGGFAVLNGAGPIPSVFTVDPADSDFLTTAIADPGPPVVNHTIRIQKEASSVWPAIDFTTYPRGEGFALADESTKPHTFPFTSPAADVTFTCTGTNGACGADSDQTGTLEAIIVSGRTTKKDVSTLKPFEMPPITPGEEYVTFQCGFLFEDAATMPAAAVQKILDSAPTRVEVRVLRVVGTQVTNGTNTATIVVGHGLVGHTTAP